MIQNKPDPGTHFAVPDTPPTANTDHVRRKYLDVPYAGVSPLQKLDIYLPDEGEGPFPVILSIHGGAFMGCDKGDVQVMPMLEGLKRGYAVASVNYRLSGEARFPALIQDLKAAIRWLRGHAGDYRLDPRWMAAWGGSAGGWQATMAGVSGGVAELEDLALGCAGERSDVQAVVAWFGPTDFLKMDEQLAESGLLPPPGLRHNEPYSPESLLLGKPIAEAPDLVRRANPESYVRPGLPPFLLQHGTQDAIVPVQQSINLAARLRAVLGEEMVTLELLEGADHADPAFEKPQNVGRVLDFLDTCLKQAFA
jgi:acetyl esterase/lipase